MSSVSVPVIDDDIVEENETHYVLLTLSSSVNKGIRVGRRKNATVTIIDSTGNYRMLYNGVRQYFHFHSGCKCC